MTVPRAPCKAAVVALAVVGLSLAPYVVGGIVQTKDQVFGGFVFDLVDSNSYLAVMQQGMRGELRFISLYTPEPQQGVWMYTFYTLLGCLVRWTGLPLLVVYHGARAICSLLLLLIVYHFACFCLRQRAMCWTALWLTALSSGLGWLSEMIWPTMPDGTSPLDFWFLEAYTFFSILTFPHFTLAWAALLIAFWAALAYDATPRPGYLLAGGAAAFIATSVHPTLALNVGGILAVYGLVLWVSDCRFPRRWAVGGLPIALGSCVVGVYLLLAFRADPVLSSWSQAVMLSPPPRYFLSGYGFLIPLALVGTVELGRRRDRRGWFLISWVVVAFSLAYIPFNLQRRLLEGVHIPISLLAAVGLHRCVLPAVARSRPVCALAHRGYPRRRAVWLARNLLIVLTWLSNLYLIGSASITVWARAPKYFHSADQMAVFDWMGDHLAWDDTVLASYEAGNLIPAWTGCRVFLGHWAESPDWLERKAQVQTFFDAATTETWRVAFLRRYGIRYVFHGPGERALGGLDPDRSGCLERVFRQGGVSLYKVR
jgi:hypothetical protein